MTARELIDKVGNFQSIIEYENHIGGCTYSGVECYMLIAKKPHKTPNRYYRKDTLEEI
jgi:hypothetical protein